MQYSILHNGVPIGQVELDLNIDPAVGVVRPLDGYNSLRERVRSATASLSATISGATDENRTGSDALADGAALGRELELHDRKHGLVQVDFIELADWEGRPLDVTVWVRSRTAIARVHASRPTPSQRAAGSSRRDA